jgi:hypothetical protein
MPELRIVPEPLWEQVQGRMTGRANVTLRAASRQAAGRPGRYLLSGLLKCAQCGANYIVADRFRYAALLSSIEARLFVETIVASLGESWNRPFCVEFGKTCLPKSSSASSDRRSAGYVKRIPTARGKTQTSDGSTWKSRTS